MNYYIQGNKDKAEQIKAAFDAKGIYSNFNFANENNLYFSCDRKIIFCSNDGGLANIIITHPDYKELELPVEPKFNGRRHAYIDGVKTIKGVVIANKQWPEPFYDETTNNDK